MLTIFGLSPTHSATPPKRSEGFSIICSYGPTTTQQQVHNRTPAGFTSNLKFKDQTSTKLTLDSRVFMQN